MPILPPNSDPDAGRPRPKFTQALPKQQDGAVLVGGDGSGYRFTNADWQNLAVAMNVLSQQYTLCGC